ncbi:MAG: YicC family protein [Treponema sp.]|nr:YicC family protein [Treponema sp.]
MNSMTGYGYKEVLLENSQISVEIKSVNSRFLDLNIYLPSFLSSLETDIRRIVSEKIVRGKVDISIRVKNQSFNTKVNADSNIAKLYYDAACKIADELGIKRKTISLDSILNKEGVFNITHDYDVNDYWKKIEPVFNDAFEQFKNDRKREGENLKLDLLEKLDVLDKCANFFKEWQPTMENRFKETITAKFKDLVGEQVDENRIMTEVASMLVKYTINEEIIRLKSHLDSLRKEINENPIPGKRLDFICQEINREINTIGSKNQFTEVGAMVINAKDSLENIREQSKNVE